MTPKSQDTRMDEIAAIDLLMSCFSHEQILDTCI